MKLNKKGAGFEMLIQFAFALVVVALVVAFGLLALTQVKTEIVNLEGVNTSSASTFTTSYNATQTMTGSINDFAGWTPIIVVVGVGVVILGLVLLIKGAASGM